MREQKIYRAGFYIRGLLILAMGLTLNFYNLSPEFRRYDSGALFGFCSSGDLSSQHKRKAEELPSGGSSGPCAEK